MRKIKEIPLTKAKYSIRHKGIGLTKITKALVLKSNQQTQLLNEIVDEIRALRKK